MLAPHAVLLVHIFLPSVSSLKPNSRAYKFIEVSGHTLRVLRLEVSEYNAYITNQFQTTFAQGRGGGVGVKSNYVKEFGLW